MEGARGFHKPVGDVGRSTDMIVDPAFAENFVATLGARPVLRGGEQKMSNAPAAVSGVHPPSLDVGGGGSLAVGKAMAAQFDEAQKGSISVVRDQGGVKRGGVVEIGSNVPGVIRVVGPKSRAHPEPLGNVLGAGGAEGHAKSSEAQFPGQGKVKDRNGRPGVFRGIFGVYADVYEGFNRIFYDLLLANRS